MNRSVQDKINIDYMMRKYRNRLSKELKKKSGPNSISKEF